MDFKVEKQVLLNELELAAEICETRTTIPILGNFLLEAFENGVVALAASDLNITMKTSFMASVIQKGKATVPARKLTDIVRLLPDGEVQFTLMENNWVQIVSGSRRYKLVGLDPEQFPKLALAPGGMLSLPAPLLSRTFEAVRFAISKEESRYTIDGALLILSPDSIKAVATDGHRLAMFEGKTEIKDLEKPIQCLVPTKAIEHATRLAKAMIGENQLTEFSTDDPNAFFRFGERLLVVRLMTGGYPNYQAIIPKDFKAKFNVERGQLEKALQRVGQLSDRQTHAVKFTFASDGLELSSQSPEYGEAKEAIESPMTGEPLVIGFNGEYVLDFVSACEDGQLSIEMIDNSSAAMIRPVVNGASRHEYVVMPMRI